jgi:LysM repeat protein
MGSGKTLRRLSWRGLTVIGAVGGLMLIFALTGAGLAVTEEDIGASSGAPSPSRPVHATPSYATPEAPRPVYTPSAVRDETPNLSAAANGRAHPTFPYTIRPGDTLGTIAATFGVTIPDITRINRMSADAELSAGDTLRIPNPFVARERSLLEEIDESASARQAAEQKAEQSEEKVSGLRTQLQELQETSNQNDRDLRILPWWRALAVGAAVGAFLMFGAMVMAVVEWWILRSRFRAAAEMNESLRRLDYKYKAQLAKAELRLQELYGRRRRGIQDGQERTKIAEEAEIEGLNRQLKEILERHLERLRPPGESAKRARWRELISGIGSPVEARSLRR